MAGPADIVTQKEVVERAVLEALVYEKVRVRGGEDAGGAACGGTGAVQAVRVAEEALVRAWFREVVTGAFSKALSLVEEFERGSLLAGEAVSAGRVIAGGALRVAGLADFIGAVEEASRGTARSAGPVMGEGERGGEVAGETAG